MTEQVVLHLTCSDWYQRNKKKIERSISYLHGAELDKCIATWLASFWAASMPKEILKHDFSKWGEHFYESASVNHHNEL